MAANDVDEDVGSETNSMPRAFYDTMYLSHLSMHSSMTKVSCDTIYRHHLSMNSSMTRASYDTMYLYNLSTYTVT